MPKPLKVYQYAKCGTCKKALKFLDQHHVPYETVPIREQPPTKAELRKMLGYMGGDIKKLLNTSSQDYRSLNLKDKLPRLTADGVFKLLADNGNLVKRPFVLGADFGLVGFKEDIWRETLL